MTTGVSVQPDAELLTWWEVKVSVATSYQPGVGFGGCRKTGAKRSVLKMIAYADVFQKPSAINTYKKPVDTFELPPHPRSALRSTSIPPILVSYAIPCGRVRRPQVAGPAASSTVDDAPNPAHTRFRNRIEPRSASRSRVPARAFYDEHGDGTLMPRATLQ